MHVLHVLDHSVPLQSGYSFRTLAILREQRARGWQTSHVTTTKQGPGQMVEESHGFRFHRTFPEGRIYDELPALNQWAVVRDLKRRLRTVVRNGLPDILHAHSPCLTGMAALAVGREVGIPVIYEMRASWEDAAVTHGTTREGSLRYRVSRALETRVLRQANGVTTICDGLRREILARGIPAGKVAVIPNAVDIENFPFEPEREPEGVGPNGLDLRGRTVLGFIGSMYAYEGLEVLLEAMEAIVAQTPAVHLLIVGGGPEKERLQKLAANRGLRDRITFTGRVPHDQVCLYYDLVDIFVYPRHATRLTDMVTPLKPLEAMARGRLVVASNVGGHRELITDGETGWLFPAGDARALARVVGEVTKNPGLWPGRKAAARRFVERERTWPASVARYETVYGAVLGK